MRHSCTNNTIKVPQSSCSCRLTRLISGGTPSPWTGKLKVSITTPGATWVLWPRLVLEAGSVAANNNIQKYSVVILSNPNAKKQIICTSILSMQKKWIEKKRTGDKLDKIYIWECHDILEKVGIDLKSKQIFLFHTLVNHQPFINQIAGSSTNGQEIF